MTVSECRISGDQTATVLTELQMFLRSCEKLGHSRSERFTVNRIACAEEVLTDEKGEDIDKVRVERDFLERQVIN